MRTLVPSFATVALLVCSLAVLLPSAASGQSATPCTPAFTPMAFTRGLPHAYADQGLQSIPKLYPKHQMLVQRRIVEAQPIAYSLLVYRKDLAVDAVTIEGVAVHEQRAWHFTTTCDERRAWDGLIATLERLAALPKAPAE